MKNPFSNSKAVHLNNNEIIDYWVDIHETSEKLKKMHWDVIFTNPKLFLYEKHNDFLLSIFHSLFNRVVEPHNSKPFLILGGKGSGKTHILRYFSYYSRKELAKQEKKTILEQIQRDGFFSVLLELGNFQFERFQNSKLNEDVWQEWFYYYLNLILIESFLAQIIDLKKECALNFDYNQIKKINDEYFFNNENVDTIDEIYTCIKREHKKIDKFFSRMRLGLTDNLNIEPLFDTRSNRFQDFVYIIIQSCPSIRNLRVLFFLDQFEDLSDKQQKFVNTIIRHPIQKYNNHISLRIMGRLYAIKTKDTYSDNEKVLDAEITKKYLENFMKNKTSYKDFIIKLIQKRIKMPLSEKDIGNSFKQNRDTTLEKIKKRHPLSRERLYFKKLENELNKYKEELNLSIENIETILHNVIVNDSPLKEKENIWLLYQAWANKNNLVETSKKIYDANSQNIGIRENETLKHLKNTFIYQLQKDYNFPIYHCGFDLILQLSAENPRNFMDIISYIYDNLDYYEEKIFDIENPTSCILQNDAIRRVSDKFWDDAIIDLKEEKVIRLVKRINSFFKLIRTSHKPTEKTLISFSYKGTIKDESYELLQKAVNHLFLKYEKNAKKEKNASGEMLDIYYIPPILTVKWDLPLTRGGNFQFTSKDIDTLCLEDDIEWNKIKLIHLRKYNVPFEKANSKRISKKQSPSLFEGLE